MERAKGIEPSFPPSVVSSGAEWPSSLGNLIEAQEVSCTTCTQLKLIKLWPIFTAKTARPIGISNT